MQLQNLVSEPKSSEAKGLERLNRAESGLLIPLGIIPDDNPRKDFPLSPCLTRPVGWQRWAESTARGGAIIRPLNNPIGSGIS